METPTPTPTTPPAYVTIYYPDIQYVDIATNSAFYKAQGQTIHLIFLFLILFAFYCVYQIANQTFKR